MNVRRAFAEKLLARIHNNPKPVTFDELDNIPRRAGYRYRQLQSVKHYVVTLSEL